MLARDDFARDANQLLLVLDQAQADLLLGDLGVALDGVLFALEFLIAQIPEGQDDRGQKQQYRRQRTEGREAVLSGRRLTPPPAADQAAACAGWRSGSRGSARVTCI